MIVEPMAGDRLEDNLNPIGRIYNAASTVGCIATSLSQEVGAPHSARKSARRAFARSSRRAGSAVSDALLRRPLT
jgi:hypothetical protein